MTPTGPGVIERLPKYRGPGELMALLSNFDVDGDQPKPEHKAYLPSVVVPLLINGAGNIWLRGQASRTGSVAYNLDLSRRRVSNVVAILRTAGVGVDQVQSEAVGEALSLDGPAEDPRMRSVGLIVRPRRKGDPGPSKDIPADNRKVNIKFRIRMLMNLNVSKIGAIDYSMFQIWDVENKVCSFYHYAALGESQSLPNMPWLSATLEGPWNDFEVTKPVGVEQFHGKASFQTIGFANWSMNNLGLYGLPDHAATIPAPLAISTGFTIGAGKGSSVGRMILHVVGTGTPDGVLYYNGG